MQQNNEQIILNLLNLYTSYVNLSKSGRKLEKKTFHKRMVPPRKIDKHLERLSKLNNNATCTKLTSVIEKKDFELSQNNNATTSVSTSLEQQMAYELNLGNTAAEEKVVYEFIKNNTPIALPSFIDDKNNAPVECSVATNESLDSDKTMAIDIKQEKGPVKRRRRRRGEPKEIKQKKRRVRRWRAHPINKDRIRTGYHHNVFPNVKKMDEQKFFEHTRMSKSLYDWLLSFTRSSLRKSRQSILAEERLVLTLNYLGYGTPLQSLAFKHKIGKSTARQIVLETCSVLVSLLTPLYLTEPTTSQYIDIAEDFQNKWDIPNCVGAIDGKNIQLSNPRHKEDKNLILLAACDTKYKFSAVSIGKLNIPSEEGALFKLLTSNREIMRNDIPLPSNKSLYPASTPFPYYFISDTAFPLRKNIMRPYTEGHLDTTKSIFNFKISRARSIIENTFGILTARFRVLLTTIEFLPEGCKTVTLACVALHNYIMTNDESQLYCPSNFVDKENEYGIIEEGEWRNELKRNGDQTLASIANGDYKSTNEAKHLRDLLAEYFASEAISYEIEIV